LRNGCAGIRVLQYTDGQSQHRMMTPTVAFDRLGAFRMVTRRFFMTTYQVLSTTLLQKVGGESVLLDLESGTYYGLDEVGTRMLELVREHGSLEPVVAAMLREYEVGEEQLRRDLEDLLDKLAEHGLVQRDSQ
jgi:Coenzyme PQQ synthesis protein D (PqqD)